MSSKSAPVCPLVDCQTGQPARNCILYFTSCVEFISLLWPFTTFYWLISCLPLTSGLNTNKASTSMHTEPLAHSVKAYESCATPWGAISFVPTKHRIFEGGWDDFVGGIAIDVVEIDGVVVSYSKIAKIWSGTNDRVKSTFYKLLVSYYSFIHSRRRSNVFGKARLWFWPNLIKFVQI